jgi:DNA mismatch repair protein MutL
MLPKEVSRKIAAGEVIERPASVVKELVENSLDAQATDVRVELLAGGKGLIRVSDNGMGMSREDALLCFESHATSKISSDEDLESISTLGFRGEALPSIAAVSCITLKTAARGEEKGTLLELEGKKLLKQEDLAFPEGTSLEVRDLFFNLPARKKFLRSERAELNRIVRFLTNMALFYPQARFSLVHGQRKVFDYPAVASLRERIYQVFGKDFLENSLELDYRRGALRLQGFSSRPPSGRRDRKYQFFFINGRLIKDNTLQAALNQAYRNFLEKDHFAQAVLFLSIPFSDVDVNVHPTKSEIRFQNDRSIFGFVYASLEQAVLKEMGIKQVSILEQDTPGAYPCMGEDRSGTNQVRETVQPSLLDDLPASPPPRPAAVSPHRFDESGRPRVLGQYLDFYIVAEDADGILIIDQHNAHERVLFEKYLEIDRKKAWPRKLALHPQLVELSPIQELSLEKNRELIESAGFEVDAMGGQSYALKEFPDFFKEHEALEVFLALLEDVGQEKIEKKKHKLLSTMACKTAVKAGERLSPEKMSYLVQELFQTTNTALCPHGRPITLRLRRSEIEKALRR